MPVGLVRRQTARNTGDRLVGNYAAVNIFSDKSKFLLNHDMVERLIFDQSRQGF